MIDVRSAFPLLLSAWLVAGCGDDVPVAGPGASDEAYLVASRILTPSGRTFHVSIEPDLAERELDLAGSLELNGFSRAYAHDGAVFVMDSESLVITRYEVSPDLSLVPGPSLSMATLGLRAFRPLFAFLSEDTAYYVDLDGLQVVVWDPTEMALEGSFPLEGVDRDGFETEATDIRRVGDRVFVTLAWTNFLALDLVPTVGLLVIDAVDGRLDAVLEDERCAAAGGSFVDENGDLYVLGDNDDGRYAVLADRELPPPCLLRVRNGADGFDPDYRLDLRAVTGAPELGQIAGLPDRTAVTRVVDAEVDLDAFDDIGDLAFAEIWRWVVLDVDAGTATPLDVPLSALPWPPFVVSGDLYVQREDPDEGRSTLYRVDGDRAVESLTVVGEFLQLDRIR